MKTTFDLPEPLLREVQAIAKSHGVTAKVAVTQALVDWVENHQTKATFTLRDASFGNDGLQPDFAAASWSELRSAAYGDRG